MAVGEPHLEHVSDTALLVAAVRAAETARPNGVMRDPFAVRLAGARGMALAQKMPGFERGTLMLGLRCRFVDEFLMDAISTRDLQAALTLGAGLDARAWRLRLPAGFRWIEVDFQAILQYKTATLGGEKPSCQVSWLSLDLNIRGARHEALSSVGHGPAVMVTEGLLMYLPAESLAALAAEAFGTNGIRYWLLDVVSPELMRRSHRDCPEIDNLRPKDHLKGAEILEVVRSHGWRAVAQRTYTVDGWREAGERMRELPEEDRLPDERDQASGDPSGVYLFGKSS